MSGIDSLTDHSVDIQSLFTELEQLMEMFSGETFRPDRRDTVHAMCLRARSISNMTDLMNGDEIEKALVLLRRAETLLSAYDSLKDRTEAMRRNIEYALKVTGQEHDTGIHLDPITF